MTDPQDGVGGRAALVQVAIAVLDGADWARDRRPGIVLFKSPRFGAWRNAGVVIAATAKSSVQPVRAQIVAVEPAL